MDSVHGVDMAGGVSVNIYISDLGDWVVAGLIYLQI